VTFGARAMLRTKKTTKKGGKVKKTGKGTKKTGKRTKNNSRTKNLALTMDL
jgi:hypothetical protein